MKILQQGVVASKPKVSKPKVSEWTKDITCVGKTMKGEGVGCGAVLRIGYRDLKLVSWLGTHFEHFFTAVRCPQCGCYTTTNGIPDYVWEKFATESRKANAIDSGVDHSVY